MINFRTLKVKGFKSFVEPTEILIENGLINRVFTQDKYSKDPLHLNDIEPIKTDGEYWDRGDLFLSLRNLSFIY